MPNTAVLGGPGTHGACPTIRYLDDGWYYVISGGEFDFALYQSTPPVN